jgi:hypothetical protein
LDLSKNTVLVSIFCQNNVITALDFSNNPLMQTIYCTNNKIQSLNVSACTLATWIDFSSNQLTSVDVSKNVLLQTFGFSSNLLTSIDVSKNPKITSLTGNNNQLSTINLSTNTLLVSLSLNGNNLTNIDLSKNPNLTSVSLTNNYFKFSTLPLKNANWSYFYSPQKNLRIIKSIQLDSTLDLSSEYNINGNTTTYSFVTTGNKILVSGVDYINTSGKIQFLTAQTDSVYGQLVNASFPNFSPSLRTGNTYVKSSVLAITNQEIPEVGIVVYAFRDQLFVKSTSTAVVTVYNTIGQPVYTWQSTPNDYSNTIGSPGVYIVKASNGSQLVTQRVVID